jgi:hypothetical protein
MSHSAMPVCLFFTLKVRRVPDSRFVCPASVCVVCSGLEAGAACARVSVPKQGWRVPDQLLQSAVASRWLQCAGWHQHYSTGRVDVQPKQWYGGMHVTGLFLRQATHPTSQGMLVPLLA